MSGEGQEAEEFLWSRSSLCKNIWIRGEGFQEGKENVRGPNAYASFGDEDGTTVSVNAHGHIIQISRYFGFGTSGFFCVTPSNLIEPYYVQDRMEEIMDLSQSTSRGFRLEFEELLDRTECTPILGFMYDRWPRYVHGLRLEDTPLPPNPFDMCIQYFCEKGTVFQRYLISTEKLSNPDCHKFKILASIDITDLNFETELDYDRVSDETSSLDEFEDDSEDSQGTNHGPTQHVSDNHGASHDHEIEHHEEHGDSQSNRGPLDYVKWRRLTEEEQRDSKLDATNEVAPKYVALIIQASVGGENQEISRDGYVTLSDAIRKRADSTKRLEITIAYRLQLLEQAPADIRRPRPRNTKANESMCPIAPMAKVASVGNVLSPRNSFMKIQFSNDTQLDFVVRRNLEHILSVCSIRIWKKAMLGGAKDEGQDDTDPTSKPIALTCGDISGHRVGPRASLSAVTFLRSLQDFLKLPEQKSQMALSLAKLFPSQDESLEKVVAKQQDELTELQKQQLGYAEEVQKRITTVLRGHVSWVCTLAETLEDGTFSPHHWPTGRLIRTWDYLPPPSWIDTPLQLLKIAKFIALEDELEKLWPKVQSWLSQLHAANVRGTYAFPAQVDNDISRTHYEYEVYKDIPEDPKYRLTDHVAICLALEWISRTHEMFLFVTCDGGEEAKETQLPTYITQEHLLQHYKRIERKVLKRFTVEFPPTKQKMLATSRTSTETRFLLHSKDTFLFHPMSMKFFSHEQVDKKKKQRALAPTEMLRYADERWKYTNEAQLNHDEYETLRWNDPLWYCLTFVLCCQQSNMNNVSAVITPEQIGKILLNNSAQNGLCPGHLGDDQNSVAFDNELNLDHYWHATFEVPYILWIYGKNLIFSKTSQSRGSNPTSEGLRSYGTQEVAKSRPISNKVFPFTNFSTLLDQKGLVEVSDDWLQKECASVTFSVSSECENLGHRRASSDAARLDRPESAAGVNVGNIPSGVMPIHRDETTNSQPATSEGTLSMNGLVVDVGRESDGQEIFSPDLKMSLDTLMKLIQQPRTVWHSKKRIVWLAGLTGEIRERCQSAVPPREARKLEDFFDRHASHEKYFFDEAMPHSNGWETELHLSFYRKSDVSLGTHQVQFPSSGARQSKDYKTALLSQVTMSFRFGGDFFDRVWTCHYIRFEFEPNTSDTQTKEPNTSDTLTKEPNTSSTHSKESNFGMHLRFAGKERDKDERANSWQQRKVLELHLFQDMLEELHKHTKDVFEWIEHSLRPTQSSGSELTAQRQYIALLEDPPVVCESEKNAFEQLNPLFKAINDRSELLEQITSENYYVFAHKWRRWEGILVAVEDNLDQNLDIIHRWGRREQARQSDRPRWTRQDENRYHAAITRMKIANQVKIAEIERFKRRIVSFRTSLSDRLESIREDISFHGSQSIKLFTYITVIFLPLGFATGLYSTSGPPKSSTLTSLLTVAVTAIGITVFMVVNAKIAKAFVRPIVKVCRWLCEQILVPLCRPILGLFSRTVIVLVQHGTKFGDFLVRSYAYILFRCCIKPYMSYYFKDEQLPRRRKPRKDEELGSNSEEIPEWKQIGFRNLASTIRKFSLGPAVRDGVDTIRKFSLVAAVHSEAEYLRENRERRRMEAKHSEAKRLRENRERRRRESIQQDQQVLPPGA
ncbi:hypothetical protein P280DRAFT_552810 [Massarina eburnea CBS 473.64]|uniref:Mg2+ transporter zinc transport protein n=1 Tax=Massarina eburnea CBS 473.64 TaxID=1395130 RepID=A0A6A6RN99_9PLEO|nr:hypothetical protein P280DRAFT_552810 [Massarina eburnea CBS 473.64]